MVSDKFGFYQFRTPTFRNANVFSLDLDLVINFPANPFPTFSQADADVRYLGQGISESSAIVLSIWIF